MRRLEIPPPRDDEFSAAYYADIARLVAVAKAHGYELSTTAARWAWEEHSEDFAAGWLMQDYYTDDDLLAILRSKLREADD